MTPARPTATDPFRRLLAALDPWLDQVVIVGGWAHRLYRLHPLAQALDYAPLATIDTDIALPAPASHRGRPAPGEEDIRTRLMKHGFTGELLGHDRPPATHYRPNGEDSGFYAEFLTPLAGGALDRKKARKATIEIGGVVAQRLRGIELLLQHPWRVPLEPDTRAAIVRIPNAACYLAQKILIHRKRSREERARDILYIHDTLEVFGARLPELRELWRSLPAPGLAGIPKAADAMFSSLTDDIRRAALIAAQRGLAAEAIREASRYGLREVFQRA